MNHQNQNSTRPVVGVVLLEAGTDIRNIRELLGQEDVTTTEIDTHVATGAGLMGVVSLLDGLVA